MKLILYLVLVLFAFSEVNGKQKLKICLPKILNNENTNSAQEKIPFREILDLFPNQLQEDLIPFNLDNDVIRATGYLKNPKVVEKHLNISVCGHLIPFTPIPSSIILNFALEIEGDEYYLNGTVADIFYIFGKGNLTVTINDLEVGIKLALDWDLTDLGCLLMDINVKLGGWNVKLENILDGDDLLEPAINDIIGDMGPDIVDYLWPSLYDQIAPFIQKIIDKYINKRDILRNLDDVSFKGDPSKKSVSETCKTYVIPF